MRLNKEDKILIIGLGLIGGSYAKRLTNKGYEVGAISLKQEDIDYAVKNKIIKHGYAFVNKEYIKQFDIVIFALYPKVLLQWIKENGDVFKKGAILTDVSGVKTSVVYEAQEILKDSNVEFIGAHPMAGREVYGVYNAKEDLFEKANFIITPTKENTDEAIELITDLANELGVVKVSCLTPQKHDEMIAFLSQLTHCIAVSLMICKDAKDLKDYTGDSFKDLTRIANINENMWSELFLMNKEELISQMDLFIKEFSLLKQSLVNEDIDKMKELMRLSTTRRKYFDEK